MACAKSYLLFCKPPCSLFHLRLAPATKLEQIQGDPLQNIKLAEEEGEIILPCPTPTGNSIPIIGAATWQRERIRDIHNLPTPPLLLSMEKLCSCLTQLEEAHFIAEEPLLMPAFSGVHKESIFRCKQEGWLW